MFFLVVYDWSPTLSQCHKFFDFFWHIFWKIFWKFWQIFWQILFIDFLDGFFDIFFGHIFWQIFDRYFWHNFLIDYLDKLFDSFEGNYVFKYIKKGNLPKRLKTTDLQCSDSIYVFYVRGLLQRPKTWEYFRFPSPNLTILGILKTDRTTTKYVIDDLMWMEVETVKFQLDL